MFNSLDIFFFASALAISGAGFVRMFRRWRKGLSEDRFDSMGVRLTSAFGRVFNHSDILRESPQGVFHLLLFYVFVAGIGLVALCQFPVIIPPAMARVQSLALDLLGLSALAGVVYFLYRREDIGDRGFDNKREDYLLLSILLLILISGFLTAAARIRTTGPDMLFSPVASVFSLVLPKDEILLRGAARLFWRLHVFSILGFIAYLPFSKGMHVLLIPANYVFKSRAPKGVYKVLDLDNAEEFGANKLKDLNWKDLMDLDTCVRCGRCQENCPAHLTKKPLSPKKVIQDLKKAQDNSRKDPDTPLINEDITPEVVFACTTCRACVENCPAGIEHLDKFIELKRHLVLMESKISPELQLLYKNLERSGNPWGMPANSRGEWVKDLDVPFMAELENPEEIDFLFWPGCAGAFDDRYMKVVKKLVQIFKKAGYRFAVLGEEETCCGDPGRKSGNEYLFDALAKTNIETMNGYNIKKIVTSCPHCFNTLAKDYAQIGGSYSVKTHVELLLEAVQSGRLRTGRLGGAKFAYHDSCYLARYNDIQEQPRELIDKAGLELVEFERRGRKGFCCGAGGGNMFLEEHSPRMNESRFEQIVKSSEGKDIKGIAVACPFCLTMMVDGSKTFNREDIEIKDISEILYDAIQKV